MHCQQTKNKKCLEENQPKCAYACLNYFSLGEGSNVQYDNVAAVDVINNMEIVFIFTKE